MVGSLPNLLGRVITPQVKRPKAMMVESFPRDTVRFRRSQEVLTDREDCQRKGLQHGLHEAVAVILIVIRSCNELFIEVHFLQVTSCSADLNGRRRKAKGTITASAPAAASSSATRVWPLEVPDTMKSGVAPH